MDIFKENISSCLKDIYVTENNNYYFIVVPYPRLYCVYFKLDSLHLKYIRSLKIQKVKFSISECKQTDIYRYKSNESVRLGLLSNIYGSRAERG